MSNLKVGAAKVSITPKKFLPIPFFSIPLFSLDFDGVYNDLNVRVLDIDSNGERILFVTFDMTIVPNPFETIKYVCDISGLDENHVFLAATHTHTAPLIGGMDPNQTIDKTDKKLAKVLAWYEEIKKAIKTAIEQAAKNKQPAKAGFGKGKSFINVCRVEVRGDKAVMGVNFERNSDKTLKVLKFVNMKDEPIAFIVNYAVHATITNGSHENGKIKICSDLPGTACDIVEEKYKKAVCLWTSGAAGDQNPVYSTQFPDPDEKDFRKVPNLGDKCYVVLEYLAKTHARNIFETEQNIVCNEINPKLTVQKTTVSCEGRTPENIIALAKMFHKEVPHPADVKYSLRLVTLGDTAIQGISGEIVTSIGAAATSVSPYENTMLITQADYYTGYVPDDWEYEHNAFEAEGATVAKGAAQPAFVEGFKKLYSNLK